MTTSEFEKIILQQTPILDVRAEVEFQEGSLPYSFNLPILDNDERKQVGTCYKQKGREAALELGHQIVSGTNREKKLKQWIEFFKTHPDGVLTCFRGGLRSQITQQWLKESGLEVPRIHGGTKAFRNFLLENLNAECELSQTLIVSGPTGAGKTLILDRLKQKQHAVLPLEELAHHRGSAFGGYATPQPSQIHFENTIAAFLIQNKSRRFFFMEDESRMIGQRALPEKIFQLIRQSPILLIEEPIDDRAWEVYRSYILETALGERDHARGNQLYETYKIALKKISKKLGGLKYSEILFLLDQAQQEFQKDGDLRLNFFWIKELLEFYYDPLYKKSLLSRAPQIRFAGRRLDVEKFCETYG